MLKPGEKTINELEGRFGDFKLKLDVRKRWKKKK